MKTIFKYTIPLTQGYLTKLPKGAEFLKVEWQHDSIQAWFLVDRDYDINEREARMFYVFGTGFDIPKFEKKYLGTVLVDSGSLVWHVFEKLGV